LSWDIFHWRSRDGEEIDFLIKLASNKFIFIEAKVSGQLSYSIDKYQEVKKVFKNKIPPVYLCHQEGERVLTNNVPIALLHQHLLKIT
jgi:hypothetical protein